MNRNQSGRVTKSVQGAQTLSLPRIDNDSPRSKRSKAFGAHNRDSSGKLKQARDFANISHIVFTDQE